MANRLRAERLLILAVVATACGGSDDVTEGAAAPAPAKVLVASSPAAPDAACAAGGTRLDFGVDANDNGTLDADEITASQIVCAEGDTLTAVSPSGPSDKCQNGGTTVTSGVDKNHDGKLDADEITETTEICGGGSSVVLARTTPLADGDATCPFGGTKTESGADNGAGGGAAGNGVLEEGEITTTSFACTSGGSYPGTYAPPSGPVGTSKIMTGGGAGLSGQGGAGSSVTIGMPKGTLGGNVAVFRTGKVDADFTMTPPKPWFGPKKFEVAADRTIKSHPSGDSAADGEYYLLGGALTLRESAANKEVPVTGLHVASGATLTFAGSGGIAVNVAGDVHIEGTITSELTSGDRATVTFITSGRYISGPASKVALTGAAVAGGPGGKGGGFGVSARAIYNAGAIDTSGASGDPGGVFAGGAGGVVLLVANVNLTDGPVESTGAIKATGGGGKGAGGAGGAIAMISSARGLRVKGTLEQSGGRGGAAGGAGGQFVLQSKAGGGRVAGTLTRRGGDVDEAACSGSCAGGSASQITVDIKAGGLDWSADVDAVGGKSKGAPGGSGGGAQLGIADGPDPFDPPTTLPSGTARVSGSFDLRGGAGATGGNGGQFILYDSSTLPSGQETLLFGYDTFDTSGGSGTIGGDAGGILLVNEMGGASVSGSTINHAKLVAHGGNATAGAGGSGGGVQMLAMSGPGSVRSAAVVNVGALDTLGGDGTTAGGDAAMIRLAGRDQVVSAGAVTSAGGRATGASGSAGGGAKLWAESRADVTISAPVSLKGGSGTGATSAGGGCAGLFIQGTRVQATAPMSCAGGDGNGAAGGPGGPIHILSTFGPSSLAALAAPGGAGTPAGAAGTIVVDGLPY